MRSRSTLVRVIVSMPLLASSLLVCCAVPACAQERVLRNGTPYIVPSDLPSMMSITLGTMGDRMMTPEKAQITVSGTITDEFGSRSAQIIVQAPGLLAYREGRARTITFDGTRVSTGAGALRQTDNAILESLLAHFPDAVLLQVASGGAGRRIGSHFRADSGNTPNYSGPYWTLFAYSPRPLQAVARGQALQQQLFIAIDEKTGRIAEVRVVRNDTSAQRVVTQTQFDSWFQEADQWFPGRISRLENGRQVLVFQTQQASTGPAFPTQVFNAAMQ